MNVVSIKASPLVGATLLLEAFEKTGLALVLVGGVGVAELAGTVAPIKDVMLKAVP